MAYFDPYIDATGFHYPTYDEVVDYYTENLKLIYGSEIYLESDSQDYQMVSIRAKMAYDLMNAFGLILSNQSPSTAIGTALDSRVEWNGIKRKIASFLHIFPKLSVEWNGIKRKIASYSTCDLKIYASVNTIINNGIVKDSSGKLWSLPSQIIITESPQIVTAICQEIGAVEAPIGSITEIVTPVKGWLSVTNEISATVGAKIETDEELKERRNLSVALHSLNMVDSVQAGIMSIEGVSKCRVYENDTNITDDNGIPAHSISCVVEGGEVSEIANCIYQKKGGGTGTYANSENAGYIKETVIATTGLSIDIEFCRPVKVPVYITITAQHTANWLDGSGGTEETIRQKIKEYFENITMGENIYASSIIAVASQAITDLYNPEFRLSSVVNMGIESETREEEDFLEMTYNQIAIIDVENDLTIN